MTAIADGADALALNTRIKELEERKKNTAEELARALDDPPPLLHPIMAELYRRKVATLTRLLEDPAAKDEAFETIRSMIDEVRLVPEGCKLRIDLRGELAGVLSLCQKYKKPSQNSRADAEQIKMVAGARNQRCLHLDYACLLTTYPNERRIDSCEKRRLSGLNLK